LDHAAQRRKRRRGYSARGVPFLTECRFVSRKFRCATSDLPHDIVQQNDVGNVRPELINGSANEGRSEGVMISRKAITAVAAFIVLGAVSAAPANAALPLPRNAVQAAAPAASEPGVQPQKPIRRGCVFGVFPQGFGRCFAAASTSSVAF